MRSRQGQGPIVVGQRFGKLPQGPIDIAQLTFSDRFQHRVVVARRQRSRLFVNLRRIAIFARLVMGLTQLVQRSLEPGHITGRSGPGHGLALAVEPNRGVAGGDRLLGLGSQGLQIQHLARIGGHLRCRTRIARSSIQQVSLSHTNPHRITH